MSWGSGVRASLWTAPLAEWSKASHLRCDIFGCVGSNPTRCRYGRIAQLVRAPVLWAGGREFEPPCDQSRNSSVGRAHAFYFFIKIACGRGFEPPLWWKIFRKYIAGWRRGSVLGSWPKGPWFDPRFCLSALVAQWIAHRTSNPGVASSSLAKGCIFFRISLGG